MLCVDINNEIVLSLMWNFNDQFQPRHAQLALDHMTHLNYKSMHIWSPTRLDYITWNFTFGSNFNHNIWSFWSFWNNHISLWEWCLTFHLDEIVLDFLKNHTLYFLSLFLFSSRILVCATSFCSSISLYIWRFTFGELFLTKINK